MIRQRNFLYIWKNKETVENKFNNTKKLKTWKTISEK
jgi:hypothetical protein